VHRISLKSHSGDSDKKQTEEGGDRYKPKRPSYFKGLENFIKGGKQIMIKKTLVFVVVVLIGFFVTTSSGLGKEQATLTYGNNQIVRTLDPIKTICVESMALVWNMYDPLVMIDPADPEKLKPVVAERWEVSENGKVWTFYLRKGIKFTTGNELTAKDVAFSLKRGIEANYPVYPPYGKFLDPDKGIKIIDDYTIQMTLKVPFIGWGKLLARSQAGIVDSKALKPHMTEEDPYGSNYLNDHSLGSGPFKLKEWIRDQKIILVRNEEYWGEKYGIRVPKIDQLVDLNVPEPTTQKMMLERGDIDVAMELSVDMAAQYEKNPVPHIKVVRVPVFIGTSILMNPSYPPFADPKVRKAIRYAIDYDSITNELLKGFAIRMDEPIYKGFVGWQEKVWYGYDLEKAKKLMAESNYPNGFSFTISIGTGLGVGVPWEILALKEKEDLAKIGIDMKIEQYDWSVMDEQLFSGNYQAQQNWVGCLFPDTEGAMSLFGRPATSVVLKPNGWKCQAVDELADIAMIESDPVVRAAIYHAINEIFAELGPNAFILQQVKPIVARSNIKGFENITPGLEVFNWWALYKK